MSLGGLRRSFEQPQHLVPPSEMKAGQGRGGRSARTLLIGQRLLDDSVVTEDHGLLSIRSAAAAGSANRCEQHASGAHTTRSCCAERPLMEAKSTLQVVISCFRRQGCIDCAPMLSVLEMVRNKASWAESN